MNKVWLQALSDLVHTGTPVSPKGIGTREIIQRTTIVDMNFPVLTVARRKLSYKFMAAEAFWILSGSDRVDGVAPWNSHIAQFSDDGEVFRGAYGPKIVEQLDYVIEKLMNDPSSRQAVMTTWRPNPEPSKDIPCTVAFTFMIRDGKLNLSAYMRSNDVWLGMPYDVFNFSMLAVHVLSHLNKPRDYGWKLALGRLYLTAASLHIYDSNIEAAKDILAHAEDADNWSMHRSVPYTLYWEPGPLMETLKELRDSKRHSHLRWWE